MDRKRCTEQKTPWQCATSILAARSSTVTKITVLQPEASALLQPVVEPGRVSSSSKLVEMLWARALSSERWKEPEGQCQTASSKAVTEIPVHLEEYKCMYSCFRFCKSSLNLITCRKNRILISLFPDFGSIN